ncbi:peptidylprolyl isomerase [Salinibacterium amurskyense]|uniref:FKBP-type peptidyl-prolyl cis-trans isomerase n=1 Tax=Salinibacterium amurskyense TaxID=205941 RepID=UPI00311F2946
MSVSMKRVFVRKLAVVAVSAGVVVSLAGCANGPLSFADCTPIYSEGSNSALVSTSGAIGADPSAEFPTPLVASTAESTVVMEGDGKLVDAGEVASVQLTLYSGETGQLITSTEYASSGIMLNVAERQQNFGDAAKCATVGSRVVTVGPAAEILSAANMEAYRLTFAEDDVIVVVTDVEASYPAKATGASKPAPAGLPAIVLAPNGQPGFTFPTGDAPSELQYAALKVGSGDTIASGDNVLMQLSAIEWGADKPFTNSWENDRVPQSYLVESLETSASGIPAGLAEALIGQTVGSQVLVVLPPDVGFAPGSEPTGVTSGSTLVFVFDILGIQEQ